jgi:hyperosmotically inducible periplasmic protein
MQTRKTLTWAAAALAASALIAGCETTSSYDSNRAAVDDATLSANVKAALVQDPVTRASNISVNTMHGVVELSGFVETPGQRHDAARVASNVSGVRSVNNELQITNPNEVVGTAMSDDAVSARVAAALSSDPTTQGAPIKVSSYRGVVQLAGFVSSNAQRDAAASVAGSVQGVRTIDNDLRVVP